MNDTLAFSQSFGESLVVGVARKMKTLQFRAGRPASSVARTVEPRPRTSSRPYFDSDALRFDRWMEETLSQVEALVVTEPEEEVPEVFDLQPLERRPVTVVIREVRPARFYFIDDDPGGDGAE